MKKYKVHISGKTEIELQDIGTVSPDTDGMVRFINSKGETVLCINKTKLDYFQLLDK